MKPIYLVIFPSLAGILLAQAVDETKPAGDQLAAKDKEIQQLQQQVQDLKRDFQMVAERHDKLMGALNQCLGPLPQRVAPRRPE